MSLYNRQTLGQFFEPLYYKEPTSNGHVFFDVSIPKEAVALAGTCIFSFLFMTSRWTNYLSIALSCNQGAQNRKT